MTTAELHDATRDAVLDDDGATAAPSDAVEVKDDETVKLDEAAIVTDGVTSALRVAAAVNVTVAVTCVGDARRLLDADTADETVEPLLLLLLLPAGLPVHDGDSIGEAVAVAVGVA